jgi:hypothetical protein
MKRLLFVVLLPLALLGQQPVVRQLTCNPAGTTGNPAAYSCSIASVPAGFALTQGVTYWFKADVASGSSGATVNFNGLGAKTIVKMVGGISTALIAGDINVGQWVQVIYDGTNMQMTSEVGTSATGPTVVSGTTTLTPGTVVDGGYYETTFSITGVVAGEAVVPQWPADLQAGVIGTMIASATNTIKVKILNMSGANVTLTAGATYGAKVLH